MEETDAVLTALVGGATAEDRDSGVAFTAPVGLAEPAMLGLDERGAFFTASETDARGRVGAAVGAAAFVEPTEPVGEATLPRMEPLSGVALDFAAEADSEVLTAGAVGFIGTTEALRAAIVAKAAGLAEVDDDKEGFEIVGGDTVFFFKVGTTGFVAAGAGVGVGTLLPAGLTEPAPNVPEFMIYGRTFNTMSTCYHFNKYSLSSQ